MKLLNLLNVRALFFGPALLLLASCGSYQYAGYEHDGIYSPENREAVTANEHAESYDDALYYKQLFANKAEQFNNVPEEGAIFTNIDSYSSTGMYEDEMFMQEGVDYQGGNAPWGDQPDEYAVNFYGSPYGSPFFGPFMSPFHMGMYDPFWGGMGINGMGWGPGFGHGYGYGFHNPWRWNRWGMSPWNYGFYNPWGFNRWGFHNSWAMHNPYFYGGGYGSRLDFRDPAYANGRRGSLSDYRSENTRSNLSARSSRIQDYSNARGIRADRNSRSAVLRGNRSSTDNRTYSTRASRVESRSGRARSNSAYSRSNRRSYESATQARSSNRAVRANNRSSQVRRSSSTSRSSGTVRSSSSSRSSGMGSSRSSRGRGN